MADISQYKDSNNNIHNLKDTAARSGLNNKVDKEAGKSLSTNDYTDADKALVQDSPITVSATGSDLALSTSSGNINAITVYGKSEVVDGSIKSAGEGYAVVDLGTLTWGYNSFSASNPFFYASDINIKLATSQAINENLVCEVYNTYSFNTVLYDVNIDKAIGVNSVDNAYKLVAINTDYADAAAFKTAMSGIILAYQLADPTQGNAIAIKTDNGTGIDGTMAVFETGTPLYGVSDTVRDVMVWDGSAGTVTKNCNVLNMGGLTWNKADNGRMYSNPITGIKRPATRNTIPNIVNPIYTPDTDYNVGNLTTNKTIAIGNDYRVYVYDTDYTDATDFKTAMSGVKLVYELATPTTTPLTASENASIAGLRTFEPQTHAQNNAGATMTVKAYAGTENGKAVTEIADKIDVLSSDKETKSVELSYADYVALPTKDPETSYYVPDAPDTWIFGYDLDKDDENPFTRVSYPADVDNTFYTPAAMDYTNDVFNYGSWNFKPGEKFMPNPCMLLYNGTVGYYLDPNDNTKKADGTASDVADTSYGGNAMMEWGLLYTKRWEENGVYKFRVSNVRIDADWECWCNYDINNNVIPHFYTPIYFGSYDGTRMRSLSGQSNMVSTTRQQEIDRAKANGDGWFTEVYSDSLLFQDLCIMMSKCTDVQTAFGMGRVKSSNTSAIAPGTMNTKGMFWGSIDQTSGVKIFGMENPYGNIWRGKAGYMYINGVPTIKMTQGTHDGSTATDYNITGDGYLNLSDATVSSSGWLKDMITTSYGRFPKTAGGASNKYECDYALAINSGTFYLLFGGDWGSGLIAGFIVYVGLGADRSSGGIGAALSCKPSKEVSV